MSLHHLLIVLAGCAGDPETTPATTTPTTTLTGCEGVQSGVVTVTTRDEVELVGDYLPPPTCGAPGIVLLHMIPPANDRKGWPRSFRTALNDAGFAVIAIDRRGAGDSGGVPLEAYEGPNGKYDVEAAVDKLVADGAGPIAVIGASNGTTSMIDYAAWAPSEGLPEPFALGFMTGGAYTENQTAMTEVPPVPAVFTYSTAERDWSEQQRTLDPGTWVFLEVPDGDHGTRMFDAAPEVADDLVAFFVDNAPAR